MDRDHDWWGYVYPKNLDKHSRQKLIVAQTVPQMRVCADFDGSKYLNNVRVNGILNAAGCDMAFLLGVLNGAVADFVFRRTKAAGLRPTSNSSRRCRFHMPMKTNSRISEIRRAPCN